MSKPTIDELERILDGNALPTKILPNGEIKLDYERCAYRIECRASKSKETAPSASSNTIKAEIAAIIMHLMNTEWDTSRDEHRVNVAIDEMRQLSAVD